MGEKQQPHRGPRHAGLKSILVYLTAEEYEALTRYADESRRSRASQAAVLVAGALRLSGHLPKERA